MGSTEGDRAPLERKLALRTFGVLEDLVRLQIMNAIWASFHDNAAEVSRLRVQTRPDRRSSRYAQRIDRQAMFYFERSKSGDCVHATDHRDLRLERWAAVRLRLDCVAMPRNVTFCRLEMRNG